MITAISACFVLMIAGAVSAQKPIEGNWQWRSLPTLPQFNDACCVGSHNGTLIVAGGLDVNTSDSQPAAGKKYSDSIYVLEEGGDHWLGGFRLPVPLARAAAVSADEGMIILGGENSDHMFADVRLIKWDKAKKEIQISSLPSLPSPCANAGAVVFENVVYVLGGHSQKDSAVADNHLWQLNLNQQNPAWLSLPPCPDGLPRLNPLVVIQNNGSVNCLYLFGGGSTSSAPDSSSPENYRYDFSENDPVRRWKKIADTPVPIRDDSAVAVGQTHIMIFTQPTDKTPDKSSANAFDCLVYHTITDTWVPCTQLPNAAYALKAISYDTRTLTIKSEKRTLIFASSADSTPGVNLISGIPYYKTKTFGLLNYLTLGAYFAVLVVVGVYFSRRTASTNDFLLAGKRIPGWVAGMSIYGSTFSAISFMGSPAKVYATDWLYLLASVAMMPVMILTMYYFIPFACRLKITTAYEYLEKRFNLAVRLFGSSVFILFQFGRIAIMLLLPALALSAVTGLHVQVSILAMGGFCILYTVIGGIEAVIWNDCLQVTVMTGAIIAILVITGIRTDGGLAAVYAIGQADHKLTLVNWSWDYTVASFWVVVIGNFLSNFAPYITDQTVIQRYLTTPSEKTARQSLWFNFWFLMPNSVIFFMVGTALYVYYKTHPAMLNPAVATDAILPWFIATEIPAGLCGIVIAGIFATSMGCLASSLHAMTTAMLTDFVRRFSPAHSDAFYLKLARVMIVVIGVLGTGMASIMAASSIISLWDMFLVLLGLLGGGLAGVFALGILTRRTNGTGAFLGAIASAVLVFWIQKETRVHFFLYGGIGMVSAMIFGYLFSLFFPQRPCDIDNLTLYGLRRQNKIK